MKNKVIVDTSLFVAQVDSADVWHRQASALASGFIKYEVQPIFFDCVINETITVLCRRFYERKSGNDIAEILNIFQNNIANVSITWIYPAIRRYFADCLDLIKLHKGRVNFHDALIALAAKEINLPFIASFDRDFDSFSWLTRIADVKDLV